MTILQGDIVLAASAVMNDVPEGGGAPSATLIVDGADNGIFPDISELDRTLGRVNLRKIFAEVRTLNTDGYFGVNMIVSEPPLDPNVSVALFSTGDSFDVRTDAASRIESYLAQGPIYQAYLYGNAIAGQASIAMMQRTELALPVTGDTLALVMNEGTSNVETQYVRITDVASQPRTFTDSVGDFTRTEVTVTLSNPLTFDLNGFDAFRYDSTIDYSGKCKIYSTIVADAAQYFGIMPLASPIAIGDVVVNATGILAQLVPSTRVEIPIADSRMNEQADALVLAGNNFTGVITAIFTPTQDMFVGGTILPGTFSLTRAGVTLSDKGGALLNGTTSVGTIDYGNGILSLTTNVFGNTSGQFTVAYTPAAQPTLVSDSIGLPVTSENQRLSWLINTQPIPTRGSLSLSYRALGHWYQLTDDGSGGLRGSDSSFGAGSINFTTGTVSVTLGALPDVGSQIILGWAPSTLNQPVTKVPVGSPTSLKPSFGKRLNIAAGQYGIKPGTMTFTWNDGTARTASDLNGLFTGDAIGQVNYSTGDVDFRPNTLPAVNTAITLTLTNTVAKTSSTVSFGDGGDHWTFNLGDTVKQHTVDMAMIASFPMSTFPGNDVTQNSYLRVSDDGAGNLYLPNVINNLNVGTVNYATGDCTLFKSVAGFISNQPVFEQTVVQQATSGTGSSPPQPEITKTSQTGTANRTVMLTVPNGLGGGTITQPAWQWWVSTTNVLEARFSGSDGAATSYPFAFDQIFLESTADTRVSNFQLAAAGGAVHNYQYLPSNSTVIVDPSPATGVGTAVGSVSAIGTALGILLTTWPAGYLSIPQNVVGITQQPVSTILVDSITFRSAVAPLFNGGFSVQFSDPKGLNAFSAIADGNGYIKSTDGCYGIIDYDTGVSTLRFGTLLADSSPDGVDISYLQIPGVNRIQPAGAPADTLRYNAVGYSYIPLNADILGLDPVRLPPDGRVPIFKPGSVAVIGCSRIVGPAAVSNGQTIDTHQVRLSRIRVIGSDGIVTNVGYTQDLEAGTITFTDVSTYVQPMTIEYRIEDMGLVSDAQISGQLQLTQPVTHAYPVPGSYVSSALVAGDLSSRVSLYFDQQTWTNVFSDDLIGSSATASFNGITYPITVTNAGTLTERWAILFTAATAFEIIGEDLGIIGTGNTATDSSPLNTSTGVPYFTIPALGWGTGWVPGNVLRFNTVGCEFPIWVIRTIQQGPVTVDDDSFQMLVRGDVNKP